MTLQVKKVLKANETFDEKDWVIGKTYTIIQNGKITHKGVCMHIARTKSFKSTIWGLNISTDFWGSKVIIVAFEDSVIKRVKLHIDLEDEIVDSVIVE